MKLILGGRIIIDRYIGGVDEGSRQYGDQCGVLHVSGDRAVVVKAGEITMLCRYNDIINRAGESISLSVMERVLKHIKRIQSSLFISVCDDIGGQAPMAVIKMTKDASVFKHLLHGSRHNEGARGKLGLERVMDL